MRNGWVADSYEAAIEEYGHVYIEHLRNVSALGRMAEYPDLDSPERSLRRAFGTT